MQMQCDCVLGFPISKSLVVASRPRGLAPNRASSRGRAHNLRLIDLLFGSERNVALALRDFFLIMPRRNWTSDPIAPVNRARENEHFDAI